MTEEQSMSGISKESVAAYRLAIAKANSKIDQYENDGLPVAAEVQSALDDFEALLDSIEAVL